MCSRSTFGPAALPVEPNLQDAPAQPPRLAGGYRVGGAPRVEQLRQAIVATSRPVMFGNPRYPTGLPDAVAAVGLAPGPPFGGLVPVLPGIR